MNDSKRQQATGPSAAHLEEVETSAAGKHSRDADSRVSTMPTVHQPEPKAPDSTQTARTIPYFFAAFAGLVYAVGFLVEFTFMNSMGIKDWDTEPFKAKHIYIGFLCLIFPASLMITILSTVKIRRNLRKAASAEKKLVARMIIPSSLLFVAFLLAFYLLIAFSRPNTFQENEFQFFAIFFLSLMGPSLTYIAHRKLQEAAGGSEANRAKTSLDKDTVEKLRQLDSEPETTKFSFIETLLDKARSEAAGSKEIVSTEEFAKLWKQLGLSIWISWGLVIIAAGFTFSIFWGLRLDLIEMVKEGGYLHFGMLSLAGFLLWRWDLNKERRMTEDPETRTPATVLTVTLVCPLIYLAVLAFGGRLYCYIPVNRGGGDFTTESPTLLQFDPAHTNSIPTAVMDLSQQNCQSKPLFIVQQNSSAYFLAIPSTNNNQWTWRHLGLTNKPSEIFMIRRDAVVSYRYKQSHVADTKADTKRVRPSTFEQ
jgi:hypothetical protein